VIIVGALVAAGVVAKLFGYLVAKLIGRLVRSQADTAVQLRGPVVIALALGLWQLALAFVDLPDEARATLHDIARVVLVLSLVWLALRTADLVVDSWFDLEAMAWFSSASYAEFQTTRDQLLLDCLDVIAAAGAALNGAPVPVTPTPPPAGKPSVNDKPASLH
jgi:hypothetical protein